MCQKTGKVFKQFYALMLTSHELASPKALQVFNRPPTKQQIQDVVIKHVIGKSEPVPHMYAEKPKVHLVPIHIPLDILYH